MSRRDSGMTSLEAFCCDNRRQQQQQQPRLLHLQRQQRPLNMLVILVLCGSLEKHKFPVFYLLGESTPGDENAMWVK